MRLFLRVVLLVACVPLLFPPGVCACGAVAGAPIAPALAVPVPPQPIPTQCCGCGYTPKHATTAAEPVAVAPQQDDRRAPHAPSCPVVSGVERAQWIERADPVDHVTALAFVCAWTHFFVLDGAGPERAAPDRAPEFEDRPRYLTHCALLF